MKSYCIFREEYNAPLFESLYDLKTGLIDSVPSDKFEYKLPKLFVDEYTVPANFGLSHSKEFYILALKLTNGLLATNFYDIGITVFTRSNVIVMFLDGCNLKVYEDIDLSSQNIFRYNKFPIGMYKTIVRQLDISETQCCLYVDDKGFFLTDEGVVATFITTPRKLEEVYSIKGLIPAWRDGYDGILINNRNEHKIYKAVNGSVKYY